MPVSSRVGVPDLGTAGYGVLGAVFGGPTHGFAVAALFAVDGELGRVWRVPRPIVYRQLARLTEAGLVRAVRVETGGRGPDRTVVTITAAGRRLLREWLRTPVSRAREARSDLLLKLALLHRMGVDPEPLIAAQVAAFEERLDVLRGRVDSAPADDFDRTLALWRLSSTESVLHFLQDLGRDATE